MANNQESPRTVEESPPRAFKVIIIGAAVSGLVLAHLLARARVDFVLVEARKDVIYPAGGSFGIWPNAARILDQIGCWDDIVESSASLKSNHVRRSDGSSYISSKIAVEIASEYGYEFRVLERHVLIRILYENLVEKSRILTGKRVIDIIEHCGNVQVLFENSTIEGDIVVGCDGVHSTVRQIMWTKANTFSPGYINAAEKKSITSSYRCLVGAAPAIAGIGDNELNMIHNRGFYIMIVTQLHQTLFYVCIKEKHVSHWPKRSHFSAEDAEREAEKISDMPVTNSVLFGEIWMKRTRGYLCSLEEGIFKHWSFNRTALVGDSAHKLSPIGAHGGNCAIESAAAFANTLVQHLLIYPDMRHSTAMIQVVFEQYQKRREQRVQNMYNSAYFMTRLVTWDTHTNELLARYVMPWKSDIKAVGALIKGAVKIDYLRVPCRSKGFADVTNLMQESVSNVQSPRGNKYHIGWWVDAIGGFIGRATYTAVLTLRDWTLRAEKLAKE